MMEESHGHGVKIQISEITKKFPFPTREFGSCKIVDVPGTIGRVTCYLTDYKY
jgi:hypothetical protein